MNNISNNNIDTQVSNPQIGTEKKETNSDEKLKIVTPRKDSKTESPTAEKKEMASVFCKKLESNLKVTGVLALGVSIGPTAYFGTELSDSLKGLKTHVAELSRYKKNSAERAAKGQSESTEQAKLGRTIKINIGIDVIGAIGQTALMGAFALMTPALAISAMAFVPLHAGLSVLDAATQAAFGMTLDCQDKTQLQTQLGLKKT